MTESLFQNIYRTQTTRVKWHAYDCGIYFITICTHDKKHHFGGIKRDEISQQNIMQHNTFGLYAQKCLEEVKIHQPYAEVPLYVVMPNHIHALVFIHNDNKMKEQGVFGPQSKNLGSVVRGIKVGITKFAKENNIDFKWQQRYYDHIIRNQEDLNRVAEYIQNNIGKWDTDPLNEKE